MSSYNISITLESIRNITVMFLDIFIMWILIYYAIRLVRSSSRTIQIFKGIVMVVAADAIASFLGLKTVAYITDIFINWGFLAIIIIFQPEIRSVLERLGKNSVFSRITTLTGNEKEHLVDQIVTATMLLSKDQTGALISIEQSHSLDDFVATGTRLNSDVTAELLTSIFVTSTPLHDGAVIIQGDKIACASAYFPPTNLDLPSKYGARHRAAIGISEITDAVTIVVSEETGNVSIAEAGKIFTVTRKQLRDYLVRVICGEEIEVRASREASAMEKARDVVIEDEDTAKDPAKTGATAVLSRLAIKKQKPLPEKIESEEIVKADDSTDEYMYKLEEESEDIKLPKKKKRPTPSYPENEQVKRFEKERAAEEAELQRQRELERMQEEMRKEQETKAQPVVVETKEEKKEEVQPQTQTVGRMSPEEVKAAREAMKQKFSGKSTGSGDTTKTQVILNKEDNHRFDTTKLDLSKIMGMDRDLSRALEAVDELDVENHDTKDKGGNH